MRVRYQKRIQYTDSQKYEMGDGWQLGDSLQQIARLFDRRHTSVREILTFAAHVIHHHVVGT